MFSCPNCAKRLLATQREGKKFWRCDGCGGRVVKTSTLYELVAKQFVERLWARARAGPPERERACPACRNRMALICEAKGFIEPLQLDVCVPCQLVWFDAKEFQLLPQATPAAAASPEAQRALAQAEVALLTRKAAWERERAGQQKRQPSFAEDLADLKTILTFFRPF